MRSFLPRYSRRVAFTLAELMIAVAIFAVGGAIVYPLLSGDMQLYARNFSINKSDNSLRYSLQMLKRDINMGIEAPRLMDYTSNAGIGTLAASGSTTSAQAIIVWVNLGPAYELVPTSTTGTTPTITPANGVTLTRAATSAIGEPTPPLQIGDRLVIENPFPYATNMPDAKATCGAVMQAPGAPGRRITAISNATSTSITVNLDLTTPLPSGIPGNQTAYIVREVAYVVTALGPTNNPTEADLVYYPTTANMRSSRLLVRDLDPSPQEIDFHTNATIRPFNLYSKLPRSGSSPLSVCLPIRAVDYAYALNDRNLGGAATNTSATEFDVYLRSATQMTIKADLVGY